MSIIKTIYRFSLFFRDWKATYLYLFSKLNHEKKKDLAPNLLN